MRIEIENNRTPINEIIDNVRSIQEPIELTSHGEVVATLSLKPDKPKAVKSKSSASTIKTERAAAAARGWEVMDEARQSVKKSGLTQLQIDRLIDRAVTEVRKS